MTPQEYQKFRDEALEKIKKLQQEIYLAWEKADPCPPPKKLRPALPTDIVVGNILWYFREEPDEDEPVYYWHEVCDVYAPHDAFKAYCDEHGSRYGLDGAFVEDC